MKGKRSLETRLIHGTYDRERHHGSLTPPIYQTSTFSFASAEQGEARFAGDESGYIYSRLGNPTVDILEKAIADLENAEAGAAFSSGMAAVSSVLLALVRSGDHILVSEGVYGCTYGFLEMARDRYNIDYDLIDMSDEETVRKGIRENTKAVYVETPINPTMKLIDLDMVIRVAKEKGVTVVVDNTFCSPYLQQPLDLGADVVIHSATKYICGHGDVIAGLAAGKAEFIQEMKMTTLKDMGGVMAPFDAWLLLRGLKTLSVRMDRHCRNAEFLFHKLKEHPEVSSVVYPGDPSSSQYELASRQMRQPGGLITFEVRGGKEEAQKVLNRLKMAQVAVSLGDAETLIQHPASMTHAVVPKEKRMTMGITEGMLRLSAGLENPQDIWEDLAQALKQQ
ncbi:methionine gamma-lyase [Alteribacter natronophilus]|uniref:methionine gamma-lyase n=1 Tax=Alteribacter natronophilus TaxID=2583810 RepID=UPI00110D5360|nr:methionine gamma-lyase [Alteribacter natronophilus]TMW69903.1 methionine gamma-lyase [Alteribacter natronophilus]